MTGARRAIAAALLGLAAPGAARRRGWGIPADSFYASGWLGQIIVMVPSEQLVVARFGVSHALLADHDGVLRLVADVLAAIKK